MRLKKKVKGVEEIKEIEDHLFSLFRIFPRPQIKFQNAHSRPGYLFIIIVMLAGVMALMATVSLLLLSWSSEQQAVRQGQNAQSLEFARSCMDIAVLSVRKTPDGSINEQTYQFTGGLCQILASQGGGTGPRRLCTSGTAGSITRRLTSTFVALHPKPIVSEYEEITTIETCSTAP